MYTIQLSDFMGKTPIFAIGSCDLRLDDQEYKEKCKCDWLVCTMSVRGAICTRDFLMSTIVVAIRKSRIVAPSSDRLRFQHSGLRIFILIVGTLELDFVNISRVSISILSGVNRLRVFCLFFLVSLLFRARPFSP